MRFQKQQSTKKSIINLALKNTLLSLRILFSLASFSLLLPLAYSSKKSAEPVVTLKKIASGFEEITAFKPYPIDRKKWVILEKKGKLYLFDPKENKKSLKAEVDVSTSSEQGLLGIAFHPKFKKNKRFFLNYTVHNFQGRFTLVTEWYWGDKKIKPVKTLLKVRQPFSNHNAGDLEFSPKDGYLYVTLGDGGAAGDPHRNGQNKKTLLGSILRINVDNTSKEKNYSIPDSNPFAKSSEFRPEIFIFGVRNPWKIEFTEDGSVIVPDVGQDRWEEVTIANLGDNLGWNIKEANACFQPKNDCSKKIKKENLRLKNPIYTYSHKEGLSITGGFIYRGEEMKQFKGNYFFADFVSGRIWTLDLKTKKAQLLGQFPIQISTFGMNDKNELFVTDFYKGDLFQLKLKDPS